MRLHTVGSEAVLVLGSGATAGSGFLAKDSHNADFAPPTDKEFWKTIDAVAGRANIQTPALDGLRKRLRLDSDALGLEESWNIIAIHKKYAARNFYALDRKVRDELYAVSSIRRWVDGRGLAVEYAEATQAELEMLQLLTHMYGRSIIASSGRGVYKALVDSIEATARQFSVSALTYNYDCAFEMEMCIKARDFYYPNFEPFPMIKNSIPVLKLHGSLNWAHGRDGFVRPRLRRRGSAVLEQNDMRASLFDPGEIGNFGGFRNSHIVSPDDMENWSPMVIPPVLFKEELFFNTGQEEVRGHFENIWRLALDRVRRADLIVFVGYSFPLGDPHARWLFNNKREGSQVFVINVAAALPSENRLKAILGEHTRFCYCGFDGSGPCFQKYLTPSARLYSCDSHPVDSAVSV